VNTIEKEETIRLAAEAIYAQDPDWVEFYREVLGLEGIVRRNFPTLHALSRFEETETYRQVQQMLKNLRARRLPKPADEDEEREQREKAKMREDEPTKVITVRIPQSMHEALSVEAHEHRTSVNKLCISKLLQFIDRDLVPSHISQASDKATGGRIHHEIHE
jgi:hypothetical protein